MRDLYGSHESLIVVPANGQKNGLYDKSGKYIEPDVVPSEGQYGLIGVLVEKGEEDVDAVEVLPAHDGRPGDDQQVDHDDLLPVLSVVPASAQAKGGDAADGDDCNCEEDEDDGVAEVLGVPVAKLSHELRSSIIIDMNQQPQQHQDPLQGLYDHPDSDLLKVYVSESKLPNSGMGLFARQAIESGQYITEYVGSIMHTKNSLDRQFWYEDKMAQIDQHFCVISRGAASRANDIVKWQPERYKSPIYDYHRKTRSFPRHEGVSHNAKIKIVSHQKAFLVATRKIEMEEQIYIDYGFEYWDFFYELDRKAKDGNTCQS